MDNIEMEKILDALDRRVALGEIDIGTYKKLKAKVSTQVGHSGTYLGGCICSAQGGCFLTMSGLYGAFTVTE